MPDSRPGQDQPGQSFPDPLQAEPDAAPQQLGRYQLVSLLNRNQVSAQWEARDAGGRPMAVRFMPRGDVPAELIAQLRANASVLVDLHHQGIAEIVEAGEEAGQVFLAVELPQGITLRRHIEQNGPLPIDKAVAIMLACADALQAAFSKGIIHGNVTADNIAVMPDGTAKLTGFALLRSIERSALKAATGSGIDKATGDPDFMAPELVPAEQFDHRCDIYSLGIVFYYMLTGTLPFQASTPYETFLKHIEEPLPEPESLKAIADGWAIIAIRCMTQKIPEKRFQSYVSLTAALRDLAPSAAPGPPAVSPGKPAQTVSEARPQPPAVTKDREETGSVAEETGAEPEESREPALPVAVATVPGGTFADRLADLAQNKAVVAVTAVLALAALAAVLVALLVGPRSGPGQAQRAQAAEAPAGPGRIVGELPPASPTAAQAQSPQPVAATPDGTAVAAASPSETAAQPTAAQTAAADEQDVGWLAGAVPTVSSALPQTGSTPAPMATPAVAGVPAPATVTASPHSPPTAMAPAPAIAVATMAASATPVPVVGQALPVAGRMPVARQMHASVVVGNRLYAIGGHDPYGFTNTVVSGVIQPDGRLTDWRAEAALPEIRGYISNLCAVSGRDIYIFSGQTALTRPLTDADMVHSPEVVWTRVQTDGTLVPWQKTTPIPLNLPFGAAVCTVGNRVYYTGGKIGHTVCTTVLVAEMLEQGGLSPWRSTTALPIEIWLHSAASAAGRVYVMGGRRSAAVISTDVYSAPVMADGALGPWTAEPPLPKGVYHTAAAAAGRVIVCLAGRTTGAQPNNEVYVTGIGTPQLSPWRTLPSGLYSRMFHSASVDAAGHILVVGGRFRTQASEPGILIDVVQQMLPQ